MKYLYFLFSALLLLSACEDVERGPIDNDGKAPQQVTNVEVEPLPGGAKITYDLPDDPDLLYIEARYMLPNGESKRVNSSYNGRSIKVEGFAEVTEYQVILTSVDRSGNRSQPYTVKFEPLTPPVISTFESIKIQPDFGGVNMVWDNPSGAELAIIVSRKDEAGDDVLLDTYYSSAKVGNYTVRGLKSVEGDFSVKVRDKWNNFSELKRATLTPLYEEKLDRTIFRSLGQSYMDRVGADWGNFPRMWDNNFQDNMFNTSEYPWYASLEVSPKPIRLSRVVIWQYSWPFNDYGHYYNGGNGKTYEIWGCTDETLSEDMSGWTLLQTCDIVKPSGLPYIIGRENMTDEDYDLAHNKGHEFIFPLDAPSVRYIRIRSIATFGSSLANFAELQIFGDPR